MNPSIPRPCSADWNNMKIGLRSRHCELCSKNVIDFRQYSREETLLYLLQNTGTKTCGRFYKWQLDEINLEELIKPKSLNKLPRNRAFAILTFACLLLASQTQAQTLPTKRSSQSTQQLQNPPQPMPANLPSPLQYAAKQKPQEPTGVVEVLTGEVEIMGDVIDVPVNPADTVPSCNAPQQEKIYHHVEQMPTFPGGTDSLFHFLQKNLRYPEYERNQKIEGKVYVGFVVDKTGKICKPKVLRGMPNAPNFNTEVLRIVNAMPTWQPGLQNGKPVPVNMALPILFQLQKNED